MKTIIVIKPARGVPRRQLAHCYKPIGRQAPEVDSVTGEPDRVVALINGLDVGAVTRHANTDAKSLTADLPKGRVPLRHIIISIDDEDDPASRIRAFQALPKLANEFVQKYAPTSQYIGIVHQDRKHPHCHILLANGGPDIPAIAWNRDDLIEMQSMTWVSPDTTAEFGIEPGRHRGRSMRVGTGTPYPLAVGLVALQTLSELDNNYDNPNTPDIFTSDPVKGSKTRKPLKTRRVRVSPRTLRNLSAITNPQPRPAPSERDNRTGKWQVARQFSIRGIPPSVDVAR